LIDVSQSVCKEVDEEKSTTICANQALIAAVDAFQGSGGIVEIYT
jgi:hypothetical protein